MTTAPIQSEQSRALLHQAGAVQCPHCDAAFADRGRVYHHIYNKHGKKAAKQYKPDDVPGDSEAEWIIQGMIGER